MEERTVNKGAGTVPGKPERTVTSVVGNEGPDGQLFSPLPLPIVISAC